MGASVPSREAVGGEAEGVAQQDHADDVEVLADTGAVGEIGTVYSRLLRFGLVNRNDSYIKKKKDKQQRKLEDSSIVLQTSITDEPSESQFRRKLVKCLQRQLSFQATGVNPYSDLMSAREQVMHRIALAFHRTLLQEKTKGKWHESTVDEKTRFVEQILKGYPVPYPKKTSDKSETTEKEGKAEKESKEAPPKPEEKSESPATPAAAAPSPPSAPATEAKEGKEEKTDKEAKDGKKVAKDKVAKDKVLKEKDQSEVPLFGMDAKFVGQAVALASTLSDLYGVVGLTADPHAEQGSAAPAQHYINILEQRLEEQAQGHPDRLLRLQDLRNRLAQSVRVRASRGGRPAAQELFAGLAQQLGGAARGDLDELEDMLAQQGFAQLSMDFGSGGAASIRLSRGGAPPRREGGGGGDNAAPLYIRARNVVAPSESSRSPSRPAATSAAAPAAAPAPAPAAPQAASAESQESKAERDSKEAPSESKAPAAQSDAKSGEAEAKAPAADAAPAPSAANVTTTSPAPTDPAPTGGGEEAKASSEAKAPTEVKEAKETKEAKEGAGGASPAPPPAAPAAPSTPAASSAPAPASAPAAAAAPRRIQAGNVANFMQALFGNSQTRRAPSQAASQRAGASAAASIAAAAAGSSREGSSRREGKEGKTVKERKQRFKQSESDWVFRADKLMTLVFDRVLKDAREALAKLKEAKSERVELPKAFLKLHPCAKLLWYLQMDLLKKASVQSKKPDHNDLRLMTAHITKLLRATRELVELATPILAVPEPKKAEPKATEPKKADPKKAAEPKKDSGSKEETSEAKEKKGEEEVEEKVGVAEAAANILFNSIGGEIAQVALLSLFCSVYRPSSGCSLASSALDEVAGLLKALDAVVANGKSSSKEAEAEKKFMSRHAMASQLQANPVVVETPHTYFQSEGDKIVTIPGATHLSVEFDPRCSTETRRDFLTITTPQGEPVCDELHGRPDQWPEVPILVPGDTAVFRFRAESFNNYFGYRCLVTGLYLGEEEDEDKKSSSDSDKKTQKKEKSKKKQTSSSAPSSDAKAAVSSAASAVAAARARAIAAASAAAAAASAASAASAAAAAASANLAAASSASPPAAASPAAAPAAPAAASQEREEAKNPSAAAPAASAAAPASSPTPADAGAAPKPAEENEMDDDDADEDEDEDDDEDDEEEVDNDPSPPPSLWLLDLERTTAAVLGRCLHALSIGDAVTPAERKAHKWLASPLFAGGVDTANEVEVDGGGDKKQQPTAEEDDDDADIVRLNDLVINKEGSGAARLHAYMRTRVKRQMHDALGGETMQITKRRFIAIVLKHLGLLPLAEELLVCLTDKEKGQANAEIDTITEEKLKRVWECASMFHRTISSQFSENRQNFYAKEEKMKETKEQWDEKELAAAKAKLTWEGYCKSINDKANLLLSQLPFFSASQSVRSLLMTPPRLTRVSSAYKPNKGSQTVHDSLTLLYSAFDVVGAHTAEGSGAPTLPEQLSAFQELSDLVTQFLSSPNHVSEFRTMMKVHQTRASQRSLAVRTLRTTLETLKLRSAKITVLGSWETPFRQYSGYPKTDVAMAAPRGSHYLRNIESSGPKLIQSVHTEVGNLYRVLAGWLHPNSGADEALQALGIDAWGLDLLPNDHVFILRTGILPALERVASDEKIARSCPLLAEMARAAGRLLCVNVIDCGPSNKSSASTSTLSKLQVQVLEKTIGNVDRGLKRLEQLRPMLDEAKVYQLQLGHNFCAKPKTVEDKVLSDVLKASMQEAGGAPPPTSEALGSGETKLSRSAQEYMDVEASTFEALSLICSTLGGFATLPSLAFLSSKPSLQLLMHVLARGTLRMQRIVLRVFRVLLPRIPPSVVDEIAKPTLSKAGWVASTNIDKDVKAGFFVKSLFLQLGAACITREPQKLVPQSAFQHRNGQAVLAHASDVLALLRVLIQKKEAKEVPSDEADAASKGDEKAATVAAWESEARAMIDYALLQLPKLVAKHRGAINSEHTKAHPDDLPCVLSTLCLIGGHTPQLVTGGRVENVRSGAQDEEAMRETGDLVYLDRSSNSCRVRFDHNPSRVVECDADKLCPIAPVEFDPDAFTLTKDHLSVFEIFTQVLGEDASNSLKRKEEEEKQKEEEERKRKEREAERQKREAEAAAADWSCEICTFINQPTAKSCAMCTTPRPAAPQPEKGANDTEEEETDGKRRSEVLVSEDVLLYRQLRSVALQALCNLMKSEKSSQLLIGSSMLPALLRLSTQPTALESYKSVAQLHAEQDRLQELLIQSRDCVVDLSRVFKRKAKGNTLDHSPFKSLPVQLPNALDTASSRAMTFIDDELTRVTFNATKSIGTARANHKIPSSLLAFYFEITVEDEGIPPELAKSPIAADTSKEETKAKPPRDSWGIAFGLFRAGMQMDGVPGSYNSFAYNSSGEVVSTVARVPLRKDFGPSFRTGDVLGCGWDMRRKRVYFTKNGEMTKPKDGSDCAFTNVDGFFFPVIWCQNAGASVSINFGQRKWEFDFRNTLPAYYLQQLKDAESKGDKKNWKVSEAEMRRKTMAEDLVVMMGIYPRELCEVALERCSDDLQHAANWLIENGRRELEIMTNNMIRASEILAESKQLEAAGVVQGGNAGDSKGDDSDNEDLAEWLVGNGNISGDPNTQRRAAAASFLDDEIEQDVPVGVERKEIRRDADASRGEAERAAAIAAAAGGAGAEDAVEMIYDNFKIEDLSPGQTVTINPLALSIIGENSMDPGFEREHIRQVAGRSGLVAAVEVNCKAVQVLFTDISRGTQHCLWMPLQVLLRPSGQWQDPCPSVSGEKWGVVARKYTEVEQALSVRKVRNAVVGLVAQKWPSKVPFSLSQLGGQRGVMSILKLTAAELLSTVLDDKIKSGGSEAVVPLLDAFRAKIIHLAEKEWDTVKRDPVQLPKCTAIPEDLHKAIKAGEIPANLRSVDVSKSSTPLIQTLMEECIMHFAQAVHHPPPVLVFKSAHPYASHHEVREEVHIPGASKLLVTFDSRCHLGNDILTRLSFYRDPDYQDLISQNNGRGAARYPSFVVPGDRLWFRFTSGNNNQLWGYKFKVKPLEFRLDDGQALSSHNFELGRWLFDLFLTQMPTEVTERYIVELYDAITLYVIHARPSTKIKGVKLLIQFLLHVHRIPKLRLSLLLGRMARVPDLKKLKPLTQEMDAVMGSLDVNRTIHSQTLQALMELLATADLVQKDFSVGQRSIEGKAAKGPKEEADSNVITVAMANDRSRDVDIASVGTRRLVIIEALYGPAHGSGSKDSIPITPALQTYLNRCGGTCLTLPCSPRELSNIKAFRIDPATGRDKKLVLRYKVEKDEYVPGKGVVTTCVKEEVKREIIFHAESKNQSSVADGEPTHTLIRSSPTMFEQVVGISRFTLQARNAGDLSEGKEGKDGKEAKEGKGDTKAPPFGSPRAGAAGGGSSGHFGKGNIIATEEFLVEAVRLWSLQGSYASLVPPTSPGLELQPATQAGFRNPGYFGNEFTVSMWVFLTKAPAKKGQKPRGLLHRGYHVGTGRSVVGKYQFRRSKHDLSHTLLSIMLGAKDNAVTVHCDASGSAHGVTTKKQLQLKRWVHLAVACSGTDIQIFLDGVLDTKSVLPRPLGPSTDPILLGRCPPGFTPAGVIPPGAAAGPGTPAGNEAVVMQGVEAVVRDVRWYVKGLQKEAITKIISDSTSSKSNKCTSLKGFQLNVPDTKTGPAVDPGHFACVEALSQGRRVRIAGEKSAGSDGGLLDSKMWEDWHRWTPKMDSQLLLLFSEIADHDQKRRGVARRGALPSLLNLSARDVPIPEKMLRPYPLLKGVPEACLRMRFLFVQILNVRIMSVLPMVDFSQALSSWSLAHRLSMLSHLIFLEIKNIAWTHILQQTSTGRGHYVNINRPRALKAQERGDRSGRKSVFFQLYLQLHFIKPSVLRTENRPWVVSYQGFGGQDAGGLFRDSVSTVCSELHSQWVPLFIPVPNSKDGGVGDNQEKWLPNPSCRSALHISNYAFVGKLMGVAIRGSHMLNLDLPSLVWKPLVGEPVTMGDVKAVDVISAGQIEALAKAGTPGSDITEEVYEDFVPDTFVATGYDGKEAELKENARDFKPTWANRAEYVQLLREMKLNEVRAQSQAIRKGLGTIVPIQLLPLFTWQELEMMVCGKREIDVDYLKANTRYRSPVRENDPHVKMLWEVLREFSSEERRLFLRFVWGQSRLPYNPADFKQKFEILPSRDNTNGTLPVSHTCFFSVELPRYTEKDAMREKILYAITNCQSIDTDHAAQNIDWDDES